VQREKEEVTEHLSQVLAPEPFVAGPVAALGRRYRLAVVTSSALSRLDTCLTVTGLGGLFPHGRRFSAEDSLREPTSKPDPAVYAHAGRQLGVTGAEALAIEDSVNGARSAVGAGFPTVGIVQFVPQDERVRRAAQLLEVGVLTVVDDWSALQRLLDVS
jgi:beta-phosphoglucomutase-like phosphatase (HAD superfamily)